jgi:hypothetical protein
MQKLSPNVFVFFGDLSCSLRFVFLVLQLVLILQFGDLISRVGCLVEIQYQEKASIGKTPGGIAWLAPVEESDAVLFESRGTLAC